MKRENLKKSLLILMIFIRIGCFTFGGGWGILAQMEQEFIEKRHWITKSDLLDLVAVGKSIPGIMITNITMLFGYQSAGWLGGICAVVGVTIPPIVILSLVTLGYDAVKDNYWAWCALRGICCAVVPIIGSAAISLGQEVFRAKSGIVICVIAFVLRHFIGFGNITLVVMGIIAAFFWMGVEQHGLS